MKMKNIYYNIHSFKKEKRSLKLRYHIKNVKRIESIYPVSYAVTINTLLTHILLTS